MRKRNWLLILVLLTLGISGVTCTQKQMFDLMGKRGYEKINIYSKPPAKKYTVIDNFSVVYQSSMGQQCDTGVQKVVPAKKCAQRGENEWLALYDNLVMEAYTRYGDFVNGIMNIRCTPGMVTKYKVVTGGYGTAARECVPGAESGCKKFCYATETWTTTAIMVESADH